MKKKCRFVTKCCLFGTFSGSIIIFALSISGFFVFKMFTEMKQDLNEMTYEIERVNYEIERVKCENEKMSRRLNATEKEVFFYSTEKMNWFEANRVRGIHKLRSQGLSFFDHLPSSVYIFHGIKVYKNSIFLTTYPPTLVNVVCERPLSKTIKYVTSLCFWAFSFCVVT